MKKRLTLAAAAFAAAIAIPTVASAAIGYTTGSVNLRTGPGTSYARLTAIPAGAPIEVFDCASWCRVSWNGYHGWVSGRYVDIGPRYSRYYDPVYTYRDRYYDRFGYWDGPRYRYRDRYSFYRPGIYFGIGF